MNMKWVSDSKLIDSENRLYHVTNPEWIKNLMRNLKDDDDTSENRKKGTKIDN